MVPTHMFLSRGVGVHREKLASFEEALRSAGVAYCNLVSVSSIYPPNCKIVPRSRGEKLLNPGEITHCVMARSETNERNRLISASIGSRFSPPTNCARPSATYRMITPKSSLPSHCR